MYPILGYDFMLAKFAFILIIFFLIGIAKNGKRLSPAGAREQNILHDTDYRSL